MKLTPIDPWIAEKTGLRDSMTPDTLRAYQCEGLRLAADYARSHSTFYQKLYQDIGEISTLSHDELLNLPFTSPEDVMNDPYGFLCVPQSQVARIITLNTSSTTGPSKRLFFTEADMNSTVEFYSIGVEPILPPGKTVGVFMEGSRPFTVGDLLVKGLSLRGINVSVYGFIQDYDDAAKFARTADALFGVPSQMLHLARLYPDLKPMSILLSGDYVPRSLVEEIHSLWGCRIFNHYAMTETAYGGGIQCLAEEGFHMRDADILVQIVDPDTGRELPPGEYGEIVLSTYTHQAMPLLRYRTGDISRLLPGRCACGGILYRLDRIAGRRDDVLILRSGALLNLHEMDEVLFADRRITDFAVEVEEQGDAERLILRVDTPESDTEPLAAWIRGRLAGLPEFELVFEPLGGERLYQKRKITIRRKDS